jgi:CRP-like cAMP-binding protein
LGIDTDEELQALLSVVTVKGRIRRGDNIAAPGRSTGYSTVLLSGVACRYKMTENGRRQIFTFQYPGDFCDFDRYILPELDEAVAALSDCVIGVINHDDIRKLIAQYPKIGLALWCDAILEARIFRQRLLNIGHRPALPRIANLLCELMVCLDAIGINGATIPLTQLDLADAANISAVHMNRTIQGLRKLGILSRNSRAIEVVHRERLLNIGKFDGRYLSIPNEVAPVVWASGSGFGSRPTPLL